MPVRLHISTWTIGVTIACGGWVSATAAEPGGVEGATSEAGAVTSLEDASRPVSRIIGVHAVGDSAVPERFQRSPDLPVPVRTAAVRGDDGGQSPVITADAVREIPGDGPHPAARALAPMAPPPLPPLRAERDILLADASETDVFSVVLGAGLAIVAVLIGLWLRRHQARQAAAVGDNGGSHCQPETISFTPLTAPARSRLEALIRNELPLVEEPVQFPERLEFYGWPAGLPITRIDAAHPEAETDAERAALQGPHFLRRPHTGRTPVGASLTGASLTGASHVGERRLRGSSRTGKINVLHAAHSSDRRPRPPRPEADDPSAVPGPLERALERLAKNQP